LRPPAAVAARQKFQALSPIVAPCPEVPHAHRAALYGHERFKTFRDENWEIAIVDLAQARVQLQAFAASAAILGARAISDA
jgi:hypothetical protein